MQLTVREVSYRQTWALPGWATSGMQTISLVPCFPIWGLERIARLLHGTGVSTP